MARTKESVVMILSRRLRPAGIAFVVALAFLAGATLL
jgi:hypothetical protein